jgi:hypothetical protein
LWSEGYRSSSFFLFSPTAKQTTTVDHLPVI